MRLKRFISVCLVLFIFVLAFTGCKAKNNTGSSDGGKSAVDKAASYRKSGKDPVVTMVVKDMGTIKLELYPLKAPQTVYNFISLAKKGYYDGPTFHRIISGFMIQGGDPKGDGTGGPGYCIKGEFGVNGFNYNDLKHERGVISMARKTTPMDSAGSQFFIVHKTSQSNSASLDLNYAAFGKVLEGLDVVDKIAAVNTGKNNAPLEKVIIEKVTVDTFGDTYPEPEKLPEA